MCDLQPASTSERRRSDFGSSYIRNTSPKTRFSKSTRSCPLQKPDSRKRQHPDSPPEEDSGAKRQKGHSVRESQEAIYFEQPQDIKDWLSHVDTFSNTESLAEKDLPADKDLYVHGGSSADSDLLEIAETRSCVMGSQSGPSVTSGRGDSISPYDATFVDELERRDIYFADHQHDVPAPSNLEEILKLVDGGADPPTQIELEKAQEYRKMIDSAGNEADVMQSLVPRLVPIDFIRLSDRECTLANQQWHRGVLPHNDKRPLLVAPKPDQVLGFQSRSFPQMNAVKTLRRLTCPVLSSRLLVPYFAIEAKGEQGSRIVAKRQNLWSAATTIWTFYLVSRLAGTSDDFFDKVHFMAVENTTETIQLSCYWVARKGADDFITYGKTIRCWSPNDPTPAGFISANRSIAKAIDWSREHVLQLLSHDFDRFEESQVGDPSGQPTPPDSRHRSRSAKRKAPSERSSSSLRKSFSGSEGHVPTPTNQGQGIDTELVSGVESQNPKADVADAIPRQT